MNALRDYDIFYAHIMMTFSRNFNEVCNNNSSKFSTAKNCAIYAAQVLYL